MNQVTKHGSAILAAALMAAGAAHADCLAGDPADAARTFYEQHADLDLGDLSRIQPVVTPRLFSALSRESACTRNGDLCAIEDSPWTGAQDGEIGPPLTFKALEANDTRAAVDMGYVFVLSRERQWAQHVRVELERPDAGACWLVGDIQGPGGSLRDTLERWHQKPGAQGPAKAPAKR